MENRRSHLFFAMNSKTMSKEDGLAIENWPQPAGSRSNGDCENQLKISIAFPDW